MNRRSFIAGAVCATACLSVPAQALGPFSAGAQIDADIAEAVEMWRRLPPVEKQTVPRVLKAMAAHYEGNRSGKAPFDAASAHAKLRENRAILSSAIAEVRS